MTTTSTMLELKPQTINALQDLIGANVDSAAGFHEAAAAVHDAQVGKLFRDIARERRALADRLSAHVARQGETPQRIGSFRAAMHRWWISFRGVLQGGDAHAVLAEAERGEDRIKSRYEKVLIETAGSGVNDLLQDQYAAVKRRHDQVRDLRDARRSV